MPNLKEIILEEVERTGAITFARFMELALYLPELGYYSKNARQEDYYTNVDVHPVFGEILAAWVTKEFKSFPSDPKQFIIIEVGAGEGKLCRNILSKLKELSPDIYERCRYTCVEASPARRESCKAIARDHPGRIQVESDFPMSPLSGVVISNELFDALPFRRVTMKQGNLYEIMIGTCFKEELITAPEEISNYFEWLGEKPLEGAIAEAQLPAREWMAKIGSTLEHGSVLSIDYGYESREFFSELRSQGTALCHHKHSTNRDFYERIGEQDITGHVNFSALMKEGERWGLHSSLMTQTKFVLENGFEEAVKKINTIQDPRQRIRLAGAVKSLVHPEGMGGTFKVLLQKKA